MTSMTKADRPMTKPESCHQPDPCWKCRGYAGTVASCPLKADYKRWAADNIGHKPSFAGGGPAFGEQAIALDLGDKPSAQSSEIRKVKVKTTERKPIGEIITPPKTPAMATDSTPVASEGVNPRVDTVDTDEALRIALRRDEQFEQVILSDFVLKAVTEYPEQFLSVIGQLVIERLKELRT